MEKIEEAHSQVNNTRFQQKLGKQNCYFDSHRFFQPVTAAVESTIEIFPQESQSELNDSKINLDALDLMEKFV